MLELYIGCTPENTFISFVKNDLKITVDKSGLTAVLVGDRIQLLPQLAGDYTVTFTYGSVVRTVSVSVTTIEITTDHKFDVFVDRENTYSWNMAYYDFTATESGSYTFFLPVGVGALDKEAADLDSNTIPFFDPNTSRDPSGVFTVDIAAGDTFSFYLFVPAEGTYTIGYNFVAKDVQPDDDKDETDTVITALVIGNNTVKFTEDEITADLAIRTFTATVTGRYKISDSGVFWTVKDSSGNTVEKVDYNYLNLVEGQVYTVEFSMFSMFGITAGKGYTLTITAPNNEEEDDNTDTPTVEIPTAELILGENTVTVTADDLTEQRIAYKFVVTEAGTYTFISDGLQAQIHGSDDTMIARGEASLEAGTYIVYVITAYITEAGDYTLTISKKVASPGSDASNPIVLETLPTEPIVHNGKHDLYYTYTATEDCTISVAYGEGSLVFDFTYDDTKYKNDTIARICYFYVKANETAHINLYSDTNSGEYTYTFTKSAYAAEGDFERPLTFYNGDTFTCEYPGENDVTKFVWYKAPIYDNGSFVITFTDRVNAKYSKDGENFVSITEATTQIPVASGEVLYLAIQSSDLLAATIEFETGFVELPGTQNNPIEAIVGSNSCTLAGNWESKWYKFVAPAKGTLTLNCNAGTALAYAGTSVWGTESVSGTVSLELANGAVYYIYFESEAAAEVHFTLTFEEAAAVELNGELKETYTLTTPGMFSTQDTPLFTATQAGSYYIEVEGLDSSIWLYNYDAATDTKTQITENPYLFTLAEGETIQFRLFGTMSAVAGNTVTIKIYYNGAA